MTAAEDAAVAKKSKRRFSTNEMPEDLADLCKNVPEDFRPSRRQWAIWSRHMHAMSPDASHWFYGWCPVHDRPSTPEDDPAVPTALFNWKFGVVRCLVSPDVCHPKKRNSTLTSVIERRAGVSDVATGR